jgi:hypothetical protein
MTAINEIAVAPYPFHPQSLTPKSADQVVASIAPWFNRIKAVADSHGIDAQAWLQGFNISRQNMPVLELYVNEIKNAHIGNIAVWGYNACESVANLNPASAEPPRVVWEEVSRLIATS